MKPETITYLKKKVSELHDRFDGDNGKEFFQSIIKSSSAPAEEIFGHAEVFEKHANIDPIELLHMVLIGRIANLEKTLNEIAQLK